MGRISCQLARHCDTNVRIWAEVYFCFNLSNFPRYFFFILHSIDAPCSHFGSVCALYLFWSPSLLARALGLRDSSLSQLLEKCLLLGRKDLYPLTTAVGQWQKSCETPALHPPITRLLQSDWAQHSSVPLPQRTACDISASLCNLGLSHFIWALYSLTPFDLVIVCKGFLYCGYLLNIQEFHSCPECL